MQEIAVWNEQPDTQKVRSVVLYRWPRYDAVYSFADKGGVKEDFRAACRQGWRAPSVGKIVVIKGNVVRLPVVSTDGAELPLRKISEEFRRRVPTIELANPEFGQPYYRLIEAGYYPDGATRFGPDHHILVEVLGLDGKRSLGTPVNYTWGKDVFTKRADKTQGPYASDYPMSNAGHAFGVYIGDFLDNSDYVFGMGLGKIGSEHMADHVTYRLVFQATIDKTQSPIIPNANGPTVPVVEPPKQNAIPTLIHPVSDANQRIITQPFGVNSVLYAKWGLAGHNGVDFGVREGTPIVAVADGVAVEVFNDADGYGQYVKLAHPWGQTLYAHLRDYPEGRLDVNQVVKAGQTIGYSGNTGNSTGPHLHFGLRVNPFQRGWPYDGYVDPLPYLPEVTTPNGANYEGARTRYMTLFRQYGNQFALPWHLLAGLAYGENKFQTEPSSPVGAVGMMQFMPATWADMQTQLGVSDPRNPEEAIHAAAYYLAQLRRYLATQGRAGEAWILAAYNWGVGRVAKAKWDDVPPETRAYVAKVLETSEALKRWEDGW
jgi:murein DD-endopeptidase MepM/ murein hydrolase activator NlpD